MFTNSDRIGTARRLKKSRPFRPAITKWIVWSLCSRMNAWAVRLMFALNAPQRPRSAVMTSNRMRSSERISRSGCDTSSNREVKLPRTLFNCSAYGRALNTRSCARRSFAAETVFIAFVNCCVFFTDRIRRRISNRLGIVMPRGLVRSWIVLWLLWWPSVVAPWPRRR